MKPVDSQRNDVVTLTVRSVLAERSVCMLQAECSFKGIDYLISLFANRAECLEIEVEQKCDASRWKAEFSSKCTLLRFKPLRATAVDIEEITTKTGSFKRFPVFLRMLRTALEGKSSAVTVEVLTYNDLEELRNQKVLDRKNKGTLVPNNKRYLILTYASEFDRVHYPLPLNHEDTPDPDRLRRVISQLRAELESFKHPKQRDLGERFELVEETGFQTANSDYIDRSQSIQRDNRLERDFIKVCNEREALQYRVQTLQTEFEREKSDHRRELRKYIKESNKLDKEVRQLRQELKEERAYSRELKRQIDIAQKESRRSRLSRAPKPTRRSVANSATPIGRPKRKSKSVPTRDTSPGLSSNGYSSSASGVSISRSIASSRNRFDPTAYVRDRQEKLRQAELRRKRINRTPRDSSTGIPRSDTQSHPDLLESRQSRQSSTERKSITRKGQPPTRRSSVDSKASSRSTGQRSQQPSPDCSDRSLSPTKALQAIKEKLHRFSATPSGDWPNDPSIYSEDGDAQDSTPDKDFDEVDHRLAALRDFLKAAKSSLGTA